MKRSQKRLAAYIIYPVLFIGIAVAVYLLGAKKLTDMAASDFKLAAIKGAPEFTYEKMDKVAEQKTDGTIKRGEVKLPSQGNQFGLIQCDKIGFKAPVYYGDTDDILEKGIGVYTGRSLPGQGKTILAGGHDTTFCEPLQNIQVNDTINVNTTYGIYSYKVTDIKTADLLDDSAYNIEPEQETLILYTCYPFGEVNSERSERYYVYAEKIAGPDIQED